MNVFVAYIDARATLNKLHRAVLIGHLFCTATFNHYFHRYHRKLTTEIASKVRMAQDSSMVS